MAPALLSEVDLCLPELPAGLEGLRLLHFSDLHLVGYGPRERGLHELLRGGADLCLCTGDSCFERELVKCLYSQEQAEYTAPPQTHRRNWAHCVLHDEAVAVYRRWLADYDGAQPIYAVQGNHDPDALMAELADLGVVVLHNETRQVEARPGVRLNLCGICCSRRSRADIPATLLEVEEGRFSIALCHFPEMAEPLAAAGIDLVLAGHTHGGQLCLPGGFPLETHSPTGRKFMAGLNWVGGRTAVYTSRGLGYSLMPLRTFCPPEITRFTLRRGAPGQSRVQARPLG